MNIDGRASFPGEDQDALTIELRDGGDPETTRIIVSGEVDADTAGQLQDSIVGAVSSHRYARVEVDFHGVTFLDSNGIRTLVLCQTRARQFGCRLSVVDPHPFTRQVLRVSGLLDYLAVTEPAPVNTA